MNECSIIYADKVVDFETENEAMRAFVDATTRVDARLHPGETAIAYLNLVILGEEVITYKHGTTYEIRLHGVSHATWNATMNPHAVSMN